MESLIHVLFYAAMTGIWVLLLLNVLLLYGGYQYSREVEAYKFPRMEDFKGIKKVSLMIPAHNEGTVIGRTLRAMCELNYPRVLLEIIVINDNSKDDTAEEIEKVIKEYPKTRIIHLEITGEQGGKGKSNALNIGYKEATGDVIAVYDADNTPNANALYYLVYTLEQNPRFGAVIGQFRTRNKNKNILTAFINIETLSFQWMAQAGRWKYFRLCTIPGTNFVVRKSIIEKIGGWDPKAIAEDTEISFRIYNMGYRVAFMPKAITYEQEPETLKVWIKQRSRWVNGNFYVLFKNIFNLKNIKSPKVAVDILYFFITYVLFLSAVVLSDIFFILGLFTGITLNVPSGFYLIWIVSYIIFIFQVAITLSIEKGEVSLRNVLLVGMMYFSYCQLWLVVSLRGLFIFTKEMISGKGSKWYKTERF